VAGKVNPQSDIETVNMELIFADLATLDKRLADVKPKAKSGEKEAREILPTLEKLKTALESGKLASEVGLTHEEQELVKDLHLLILKPVLYVYNIDESGGHEGLPNNEIAISAKLEAELADLSEKEALEYRKEAGVIESGLDKLIKACYQLLDLVTFFTTQSNILQAWTIKRGTKAPEAAGVIHTDFSEGFIKAEVINWQDLVKVAGEHQAREKGLLRVEGKDYVVQDGDVIHFRFH
jgi:hypothetical protein